MTKEVLQPVTDGYLVIRIDISLFIEVICTQAPLKEIQIKGITVSGDV